MKAKSKGGGSKSAAKDVTPAIPGLGRNVPAMVRDAYLAVVKSEPHDRDGAVAALRAAMDGEQVAGSYLALAKALVYRAMDAAIVTKKQKQDPFAQLARDLDATKLLEEATAAATKGAVRCDSHLCFMLAARLLSVRAEYQLGEKFEEEVRSLIERPRDPLHVDAKKGDKVVAMALHTGLARVLQKVEPNHESAAGDVIAEDAWPFELLACSSAENMGMMLDYAKALLRQCTVGILDREYLLYQRNKVHHAKVLVTIAELNREGHKLEKGLEVAGAAQTMHDARKHLGKYKETLPLALAVTIFAPRAAALRLAKSVSDGQGTKVKDLATLEHWARHAKAEISKAPKGSVKEMLAKYGVGGRATAAAAPPAVAEKAKAKTKTKAKPIEETRTSKKDEEEQQKGLKAALASAKHRANVIKRYLDRKASEKAEKDPRADVEEVIKNELTMDVDQFLDELKHGTGKLDEIERMHDAVVKQWVDSGYNRRLWYTFGPGTQFRSASEVSRQLLSYTLGDLNTNEGIVKALQALYDQGLMNEPLKKHFVATATSMQTGVRAPLTMMATVRGLDQIVDNQKLQLYAIDVDYLKLSASKLRSQIGSGDAALRSPGPVAASTQTKKKSTCIDDYLSADEELGSDDEGGAAAQAAASPVGNAQIGAADDVPRFNDELHRYDEPVDMPDQNLVYKMMFMRYVDLRLERLRDLEMPEIPTEHLSKDELFLISATRPTVSGFATVAAFDNADIMCSHGLSYIREDGILLRRGSLSSMLSYAVNHATCDSTLLSYEEGDAFVRGLCAEMELQAERGSKVGDMYWSIQCVRLLLAHAAGLQSDQKLGASETEDVKAVAVKLVTTGLELLVGCRRLTESVASDIAIWMEAKMRVFEEEFSEELAKCKFLLMPSKAKDEHAVNFIVANAGRLPLRDLEWLATYVSYLVGTSFSSIFDLDEVQRKDSIARAGAYLEPSEEVSDGSSSDGSSTEVTGGGTLKATFALLPLIEDTAQDLTRQALDSDKTGLFSLWATNLRLIERKTAAKGEAKGAEFLDWLPSGTALNLLDEVPIDFSDPGACKLLVELVSPYVLLMRITRDAFCRLRSVGDALMKSGIAIGEMRKVVAAPMGGVMIALEIADDKSETFKILKAVPVTLKSFGTQLEIASLVIKTCFKGNDKALFGEDELAHHAERAFRQAISIIQKIEDTVNAAVNASHGNYASAAWAPAGTILGQLTEDLDIVVSEAIHMFMRIGLMLNSIEDTIMLRLGAFVGQFARDAAIVPAKSAISLLAGRVLPRIWEKELDAIEKSEAAEKEKQEEVENAAKAKEAEERANALMAEEEAAKTKKEAVAEAKKKKKKAKKAVEEPAAGAVAAEEKVEEEEEAAAPVEEQEEEEEAAGARGDDDEGMGDLIGMFAARGVTSTAPHAAAAPPPTGGPREKAPDAKVVSWDGKWQCRCHRTHALDSSCSKCEVSVCQAFVEGRPCRSTPCKKVHPAFSISTRRPPPSMNPAAVKVHNTAVWTRADQEAHAASRERSDRVVSWLGEWMCSCEKRHGFRDGCPTCGAEPPCRDALRGICRHGASCKFPHLPLDLDNAKKPRGAGKDDEFIVKKTPSSVLWRDGALVAPAVPGAAPEDSAAGNGRRARGKKAAAAEAPYPRVVEVQRVPTEAPAARVLHVPRRPASVAPAAAAPAEPEVPAVDSGVSSDGWGFAGAAPAAPQLAPSLFPPLQDAPAGGWPAQGLGAHAYGLPHAGHAVPPAAAGWEPWASASLLPTASVDSEVSAALPLGALDFQTPIAPPAADDGYDDMLADLGVATEPPAWRAAVMASVETELSSLAGPGLANEAGEYNCFLNVVVQCLWHCFEFRKRVMSWPPEVYSADPVVHALRSLFGAFAELEAGKEGGTSAAAPRAVVDPAELRQALAAYPGGSFGLEEMNDAAELLMTLYGCAQEVGGAAAEAVDAVFGLRVRESVSCPTCRASDGSPLETHQNEYVQYFFNVSATALRTMRAVQGAAASTAFLLRRIEEQTQKSCDTDKGGCDARLPVRHALTDPPAVFTLQLAWETTAEAPEDIRATMEAVQEQVRVQELYADVQASSPVRTYKLRAAVAYYGAHYSAIVYSPSIKGWVMLDDASVSKIGRWEDVVRKCQAGRIQPSVLFYVQE